MKDGPLQHLIQSLSRLPGLGNRSARRIALHLLSNRQGLMVPLAQSILRVAEEIKSCAICGNLDMIDPCHICADVKRTQGQICVVAQVSDLWAIERTSAYKGRYHVLGGLLSALDGIGPEQLNIATLLERAQQGGVDEVILALSATVDGQSTAHYIADHLAGYDVEITHLAHGVPVGGELDYLDDGTITTALRSRK
ncbi:MAG: recombination protein RecR [Micavibrio sp.]|nr:recombination protein RecR [Micavibrio sp.]|tara:strand:+ start:310 stop:897 length:588 start_codon:yes stop_codon:yes gene_type:complete